jgi:prepilin-type N-terminal cleavage/methylation domain-containing protein
MFIAPGRQSARRRAFTLLEITLAVAILGMMCLAVYRFVQTNITILRLSTEESAEQERYSGFLNLLTNQWQNLPSGAGALTGEPFKFNDRPRDEITWISGAGPGLLTRYAAGEFSVNLRVRPMKESGNRMEIGLMRKPRTVAEGSNEGETWIPLLQNVMGMRIRYFDPRLNAWVERWTDTVTLPRLIEVIIERPDRSTNWQAVVALGRTPL